MAPLIKMCHSTGQWMHFSWIFFFQRWFNCGKLTWILVWCSHHITVRVSNLLPGKLKLPRDRQQWEDKSPQPGNLTELLWTALAEERWSEHSCVGLRPHTVTAAAAGWLIGSNELRSAALAHLCCWWLCLICNWFKRPSCLLIEPWTLFYISAGVCQGRSYVALAPCGIGMI